MGNSHAASGAVGWLAACATASGLGAEPSARTVLVGAVVSAGAALLPDLDHPQSTIARSLGPLTRAVARVVSWVADWVQDRTCGCCADDDSNGHRALTHTALGAAAAGAAVSLAGWRWGLPVGRAVVFVAVALACLALLNPRRRGRRAVVLAGLATVAAAAGVPAGGGWAWLGLPVAFGALMHCVGDALTKSGCPIFWPVRIRGCRWHQLGSPRWLRFRTGGKVERRVVSVLMVAAALGSGWVLVT